MKLQKLLMGIPYVVLKTEQPIEEIEIRSISCNSKEIKSGDLFLCIKGTAADGHDYIQEAWERGASVCMVEREILIPHKITVILVKNGRKIHSMLASSFFGHPVYHLKVIGVTGTKGKTTVTHIIAELLKASGYMVGRIGTLGIQIGEEFFEGKNTTPDAFTIHKYFAKMVEMGCEYAVLEVSSQSLKQMRVEGIPFEIAVFTNLSPDHIGKTEHRNFGEYRYFKSRLFRQAKNAVGNLDDRNCGYMFFRSHAKKYGYTCQGKWKTAKRTHILKAENIRLERDENGICTLITIHGQQYRMGLPGVYNVYNLLAALQVLQVLGVEADGLAETIQGLNIEGRMQCIFKDKYIACYVDYAHNAKSLQEVLLTMRQYRPRRIWLVFGCGGGRSKLRRREMGAVAGLYADQTILTSDNPRFEEPEKIIEDIVAGMDKVSRTCQIIIDRKEAVRTAVLQMKAGDVLIVAGKGHEEYQEIFGVRYPMSDRELIKEAVEERRCTQISL